MNEMIKTMRSGSANFTALNVGNYLFHGDKLNASQVLLLFRVATSNKTINEISLSGVTVDGDAFIGLAELIGKRCWKKILFHECRGRGAVALSAPVLVEDIRFSSSNIGRAGLLSLGLNMQQNTILTRLELLRENLVGEDMVNIAEGLATSKSLQVLELSFCRFDNQAVEMLATGLGQNQSIHTLLLPGCELEDSQVTKVIESLYNHPSLCNIKLFRNHCGTEGAAAFAKLLSTPSGSDDDKRGPAVRSLDLSYQQFERAKKLDLATLSSNLATNTSLASLTLSFNKLNDNDANILAIFLSHNRVLQHLDLRANNIRNAGIASIAENLVTKHTSLKRLFLFGNPFGEEGAKALLTAIRGNLDMLVLNMDYNSCTYEEIQFYTHLNQAGRALLKEDRLNPAIWPLVLERTREVSQKSRGICTNADLIFELLRGRVLLR